MTTKKESYSENSKLSELQSVEIASPIAGPDNPVQVTLTSSLPPHTDDQALWYAIRDRTSAIGFKPYSDFISRLLCSDNGDTGNQTCKAGKQEDINTGEYGSPSISDKLQDFQQRPSIYGVDSYQLLKFATQAFLTFETGVVIKGERKSVTGVYPENDQQNSQDIKKKLELYLTVRRQLPCPVGDNYLDRLTDM